MKKLILTIAIGEKYAALGAVTHPTIARYAARIGADFVVIREQKISRTTPHWEKFQIFDFLGEYDRVLFLDSDLIIRADCPDLFALVPETHIGAVDEASYAMRDVARIMCDVAVAYGVPPTELDFVSTKSNSVGGGSYFNTGVMVVSREHRPLFRKPEREVNHFFEQSYLNLMFVREHTPMFALDPRFNCTHPMERLVEGGRLGAYIAHYAGYEAPTPETLADFISNDLAEWRAQGYAA